jgi:hypothetical protein
MLYKNITNIVKLIKTSISSLVIISSISMALVGISAITIPSFSSIKASASATCTQDAPAGQNGRYFEYSSGRTCVRTIGCLRLANFQCVCNPNDGYISGLTCYIYRPVAYLSCDIGKYLSDPNSDSCTQCPAGSYCSGGIEAIKTQCPPNQYCGDGVSTPSSCPPNTSAPAGSDALVDCMLNQVILHLKAMLSGAFDATSITASNPTGNMTNALDTRNLLPVSQPYNIPGVLYTGTETLPTTNLSPNITDWVLVEVRDGTTANNGIGNLLTSKAVVMLSDGTIKDSSTATAGDLTNNITLTNLTVNTNYKIILRHRNHLAIATNPTVGFDNSGQATLDFTNNFNIIAANQKQVGMSLENTPRTLFALRATDASGDGQIDAIDRNELITSDEYDGTYSNKDLNLDGGIDASDRNLSQNTGEATTNL